VTKHHYLVTEVGDIARVMREAFHVATTGRPGPVLIDVPKNVQNMQTTPDYDARCNCRAIASTAKWPRRRRSR